MGQIGVAATIPAAGTRQHRMQCRWQISNSSSPGTRSHNQRTRKGAMMPSFNLLEEGWIPCVMSDGEARELSLRNALIEADRIREIFDTSPLVTAALHRLLLAVLWRCFPMRGQAEWKTLWQ